MTIMQYLRCPEKSERRLGSVSLTIDRMLSRIGFPILSAILIVIAVTLAVAFAQLFCYLIGQAPPPYTNTITILTALCTASPLIIYFVATIRRLEYTKQVLHDQTLALDQHNSALEKARILAVEANAAKSQFLANMSHDLRTPLNAIIGFADMLRLQKSLFGGVCETRTNEYADAVCVSGQHLLSLVNDLLDLARIESGDHDLFIESLSVDAVIADVVLPLQPQASQRGQTIETHIEGSGRSFQADARAIRQILVNLLTNALKFSDEGTTIRLHARRDGTGMTFEVIDEGIGMTPEEAHIAVQRFTRMSDAHISSGESIGLGLSIVCALCAQHGGTLIFDSEKGRGTTARVHLPLKTDRTEGRIATV